MRDFSGEMSGSLNKALNGYENIALIDSLDINILKEHLKSLERFHRIFLTILISTVTSSSWPSDRVFDVKQINLNDFITQAFSIRFSIGPIKDSSKKIISKNLKRNF